MMPFSLTTGPIVVARYREAFSDPAVGGFATFEGWVRDHNHGRAVLRLEYEAYARLAEKEGARIVVEAVRASGAKAARCVHRVGSLLPGDLAVWVGATAEHRREAFDCCRRIIDEIKVSVPIWKKEYYADGDSGWVNCERCASAGSPIPT